MWLPARSTRMKVQLWATLVITLKWQSVIWEAEHIELIYWAVSYRDELTEYVCIN